MDSSNSKHNENNHGLWLKMYIHDNTILSSEYFYFLEVLAVNYCQELLLWIIIFFSPINKDTVN